jgi:hypothetical protein
MKLEFLEGANATRHSGAPLNEGEALVFVDDKPVKQEIIDRFNKHGHYVGERPTGMTGRLIVNLYKVSFELLDKFNEHVAGIKMTDIDDPESYIEMALIPSVLHHWDGTKKEDFYISERLNDRMYTRPSEKYLKKMQDENRNWGKQVLDDEQSN